MTAYSLTKPQEKQAVRIAAAAAGSLAVGAVAFGALAIGALAIGALAIPHDPSYAPFV